MNEDQLNTFHDKISQHRDELLKWLNSDSEYKQIHIGNSKVREVLDVVSELKDVLEKIEEKKYGTCEVCQGEVEIEQLELDCTRRVCLDCYSDQQLRALERDLELAAKVQKQLLPGCLPSLKNVQISVMSEPASIVGGDYYDFFDCKIGMQGLVIGDVMGKGLPASMLMSNLQASLRILGPEYHDLGRLAERLNELFLYNTKLIRFISLFLGLIDEENERLLYCNAGHHPPILFRASTNSIKTLSPTGPAIGLTPQADFYQETIRFTKGDTLLLYTDGLSEARNESGEEFGEGRIIDFIKTHHNQSVENIQRSLYKYVKQFAHKIDDDATMMIVKVDQKI
jgi:sigma-B regulation protein RsbU (phosphoserine phosphatase)